LRVLLIVLVVYLSSWVYAAGNDDLAQLKQLAIYTEHYPPLNYMDNSQLKGSSVEILNAIYTKLGLTHPDIEVIPWTRGYHLLQSKQQVMLFTTSRTTARENLFQWVGPTHTSRTFIVTYEGSGIEEYDPKTQQSEMILAVRSDVTEYVLKEIGYPENKIDLVDSTENLFTVFTNKRIKLASVAQIALREAIKLSESQGIKFKILATTRENQGHFALSKMVPVAVVNKLQSALDSIRSQQLDILERYEMEL